MLTTTKVTAVVNCTVIDWAMSAAHGYGGLGVFACGEHGIG